MNIPSEMKEVKMSFIMKPDKILQLLVNNISVLFYCKLDYIQEGILFVEVGPQGEELLFIEQFEIKTVNC